VVEYRDNRLIDVPNVPHGILNMPRRNVLWLLLIAVVSLVCYRQLQSNRYGRVLGDALDIVHRRSLKQVGHEKLFNGAMQGMMDQLDEHSHFTPAAEMQKFRENIDREFVGVGIEVTVDPKTKHLMVISPLPDTPAARKGILPGDRILRIDGHSTDGLPLTDAVAEMKGAPGEPVLLTVLHEGQDEPVDIKIVRERIHEDTVRGDRRNPDWTWGYFLEGHDRIGYLRITSFAGRTPEQLEAALRSLVKDDMQGLVLDLRNNGGGQLLAATSTCDMFIRSKNQTTSKKNVIVTIRDRSQEIVEAIDATDQGTFSDFPMAVLVNGLSASASEIVAACLQDHQRAVVVGQRTYGKGTVQEIIDLARGQGSMQLTVASYWPPSGKNIHHDRKVGKDEDTWGVTPNEGFDVEIDDDQLVALHRWRMRRDTHKSSGDADNSADNSADEPTDEPTDEPRPDPQLAKAVEYIEGEIAAEKDN
jgi:carboxyl-terminal processing protease